MPVGTLKNILYGLALPVLGKRCEWTPSGDAALAALLRRHHTVGACIQRFEAGVLTNCSTIGYARFGAEPYAVAPDTLFRTASVAKMVTALLVFRLQTQGRLDVEEDISAFGGSVIRNPQHKNVPITLGMLLSHTSSIVDSTAYFSSFRVATPLSTLLSNAQSFSSNPPGTAFRYSNFAAGLIACLLEKRFCKSLETLAQQELFLPLGVQATFDLSQAQSERLSDSYRVLPSALAFDAKARRTVAKPIDAPDPEHRYLLASGNLYLTAPALAKLTLVAWNGAGGFIDAHSLRQMQTPILGWSMQTIPMRHGMGLLKLEDKRICPSVLWGHQGFAYGAVNGVFFDAHGNGFASLNSGASEQRLGHLALLNRDLIRLFLSKEEEPHWM